MKIAIVCDIPEWAIGHLAQSVAKYNDRHKIKLLYVHPRDAEDKDIQSVFLKQILDFNPDIIDFEYFRTAGQLIEALPELRRFKKVLMHHNMRDKALYMWDWQNNPELADKIKLKIDKVLAHCNKTKRMLEDKGYAKNVEVIRYGFDHSYWTYNEKEPEEFTLGYAGRVVPWKGLKEIAEVAKELNVPLEMMGKQDKQDYWDTIPKDKLRFNFLDCPDEERVNFYHNISVFVQNSIDGYEEGPMPMLEAMACGVPVITTPAGQAGYDEGIFRDNYNCLMVQFGDKEGLKRAIQTLKDDPELRSKLRSNGWNTVKNMTEEKMARDYSKIWNKLVYPDHGLASVIIPATYDRIDQIKEIMKAMTLQSYPNIEVILVWDEQKKEDYGFDRKEYDLTIKELWTEMDKTKYPYNLAMARNMGIIESEGEYLMFNDSRLKPDENAIMMFVEAIKSASALSSSGTKKVWFFGEKGSNKESFVENFSAVSRQWLIEIGMFCERIDRYGGMTQEIRSRWSKNKGEFIYIPQAVSEEIKSSGRSSQKRQDIVNSKLKLFKMYGDEKL